MHGPRILFFRWVTGLVEAAAYVILDNRPRKAQRCPATFALFLNANALVNDPLARSSTHPSHDQLPRARPVRALPLRGPRPATPSRPLRL
jgi:hypothetical protein